MKGVIFNLLEEVVTRQMGTDAWGELVDAAGVSGVYTSLGSYDDAEVLALVETAAVSLNQSPGDILRWFGRSALPLLAERYPVFFEDHKNARTFILSVNDIIHPEVRKLYSGAGCPHFHFEDAADGRLLVGYRSARQMCQLAHGFVEGASGHFGQEVEVEHLQCMLKGDPMCRLALAWNA
ncbi:MAG: heme NO-binding domain-containing protein [Sphingomonadaceae bacterium]|nr:heme NO-binding domain-containing protein [Sphingomonadaceae bacterium]